MHRLPLIFAIALLLTTPTFSQRATTPDALQFVMPVRIENGGWGSLTVKLVGPTTKTLKLGPGENLVVMAAPGEYYCVYKFKGEPRDPFVYKQSGRFQVPKPDPAKPAHYIRVVAKEEDHQPGSLTFGMEEVKASTAKEFNDAGVGSATAVNADAAGFAGSAMNPDSLRFTNLNLVFSLGDLSYGETPAEKRQQERLVINYLNQYIRGVLIPRLTRQGFRVKHLGRNDEPFGEAGPAEPTIVVELSEESGQAYSMYSGYGPPSAHGVIITASVSLWHPRVLPGNTIWAATLTAENDESIQINILADIEAALHNQALKYLRQQLNDLSIDLADWAPRNSSTNQPATGSAKPRPRSPRSRP